MYQVDCLPMTAAQWAELPHLLDRIREQDRRLQAQEQRRPPTITASFSGRKPTAAAKVTAPRLKSPAARAKTKPAAAKPRVLTPGKPRRTARQRFDTALAKAQAKCRTRVQAMRLVEQQQPGLRELMVEEANPGNAHAVAVAQAATTPAEPAKIKQAIEKRVGELMQTGMTRGDALRKVFIDQPDLRRELVRSANSR